MIASAMSARISTMNALRSNFAGVPVDSPRLSGFRFILVLLLLLLLQQLT